MVPTRRQLTIVLVMLVALGGVAVAMTRERPARISPDRAVLPAQAGAAERSDGATAERAWRHAYAAARRSPGWSRLVAVADAHGRLAVAAQQALRPQLRELYLEVLLRARAQGSLEGVLRAGEGFAGLGDRSTVSEVLRVARQIAGARADTDTQARLRSLAERS